MSVIRPIFDSKANNKNRESPYYFIGYKASEFGYKGNVGYKAKISENLVCGLISDVDCIVEIIIRLERNVYSDSGNEIMIGIEGVD